MSNNKISNKDLELAQALYNINHYGTPEVPMSKTNDPETRKVVTDIAKNIKRFIDFFNKTRF